MPLRRVRTRTSPSRGAVSATERISPWPGAVTQKARARSVMEDAFVEHIVAQGKSPQAWTQTLVRLDDLGQGEARLARAEDDRRHGDLQPVEGAGDQKSRDGDAAALDKEEMPVPRGESGNDIAWSDALGPARQAHQLGLPQPLAQPQPIRICQYQRGRRAILEQPKVGAEPPFAVNDHAQGVFAGAA